MITATVDVLVAVSDPRATKLLQITGPLARATRDYEQAAANLQRAERDHRPEPFLRHYRRVADAAEATVLPLWEEYNRLLGLIRAVDPELAHRLES